MTHAQQETIDQLKEFETSLNKMMSGNISLVDSIGSVQLAIQAAIRSTTSPEILNMFLKKENGALRTRLAGLDSDRILGRITLDAYNSQATDIVKMLEKLGEPLSGKEQELLKRVSSLNFTDTIDTMVPYICSKVHVVIHYNGRIRSQWEDTLPPVPKSETLRLPLLQSRSTRRARVTNDPVTELHVNESLYMRIMYVIQRILALFNERSLSKTSLPRKYKS